MASPAARLARFQRIRDQLARLIRTVPDPIARRATAAALLHHKIPGVSWTGFYMLRDGQLLVDVYQGPVACLRLAPHTGVCWAAIDRGEGLVVPDVATFEGHIPCDPRTRSELVVPLPGPGQHPVGVLDVDSYHLAHFDDADLEGYTLVLDALTA
ncbi:MAG: GAF domain-containing protein [Acidobacteria bacterium]|nr:GAF domain-containing protein [Acidobacteriota bacterium]